MSKLKEFISFLNGFRKLSICVLVVTLATVFLITHHITGEIYGKIMTITVPSYFAGNIGEHLTDSIKQWVAKKAKKS